MRIDPIRTAVSLGAMALALGACGNGTSGTSGTSGTIATAPTAAAPTPPAPPAPPTYSTYAGLSGAQSLATAYSGVRLGSAASSIPAVAFGSSIALAYDPAGPSYTPSGNGLTEAFSAAEIDPALTTSVFTTYVKRSATGSITSRFAVSQHFSTATNTSMTYMRAFEWFSINDPAGVRTNYLIAGVPTLPTDFPATGTGEFGLTSVRGTAQVATTFGSPVITGLNLAQSQANCAIDFATGTVRLQMVLIGAGAAGAPTTGLGNFVGSGTRVAGTNRFSGTFTPLGNSLSGSFHGVFFGPQATECAIVFSFTGTLNGGPVVVGGTQAGTRGPNTQLLP